MKQELIKMMGVFAAASLMLAGCGSGAQSASGEAPVSEETAADEVQDETSDAQPGGEAGQAEAVEEAAEDTQEAIEEAAAEDNASADTAPAEIQGEIPDATEEVPGDGQNADDPEIDWEANDKSAQPADWYELQEDGYVLVLKLADPADDAYEWLLQNHYENVIEVSNETNEGSVYTLTMDAAMEEAGNAQIALEYTDAWDEDVQETVVMDLFVNESGEISVETAFKA